MTCSAHGSHRQAQNLGYRKRPSKGVCPWLPRLGEAASLLLSQGTKGTRALHLSLLDKTAVCRWGVLGK